MTFDPFVIGLVLLAALLHAVWNTLIKTGGDGLLMFALMKVPTMGVGVLVIALVGLPNAGKRPLCRRIGRGLYRILFSADLGLPGGRSQSCISGGTRISATGRRAVIGPAAR